MDERKKVILISGPTAVGKTRLALALAKQLNGEIVSADSVQVYRGLNIGSAKTPVDQREGIYHHMIDIADPTDDYSAGTFFDDARQATAQVLGRNHVPIVVGGTGLYLRWYLHGKPGTPQTSPEVSALVDMELKGLQTRGDWNAGLELLRQAGDTETSMSIERNDWYRLHRALVIIKASGMPRSCYPHVGKASLMNSMDRNASKELDYDFLCYFLCARRLPLYRAIDFRCEQMLAEYVETGGILGEASSLLNLGVGINSNSASRAIGYRQAMKFLSECREKQNASPESFLDFLAQFQQASRNFAKRQMTWFRGEPLFQWLDAAQPLEELVKYVVESYHKPVGALLESSVKSAPHVLDKEERQFTKVYRAENRIFTTPDTCQALVDWIRRTQCNNICEK